MRLSKVLLSALAAASSSHAGPTPILDLSPGGSHETELLVREGIKFARSQDVEKRASADFSLERSWNNEVLFGGAWNDTSPDSNTAEHAEVSVTCLSCYTHGTVTAKVTDEHFLKPRLRLGFSGVEAYASLGVRASAGQTFSLNLFASNSPVGIGISGLDVGVVFFVDLVFSLSEAIDLTAGFQVSVPDDAYIEADIFKGDIDDSAFGGLSSQSLPVTVVSGTATFKADLRLRVQAGAEASIDLFGIGAGAVIGIYANMIEFVAVIEKTPTCDLETEIWWDVNVGAYAHLDVVVDYTTLGPVPTVSTTLLAAETISSCWVEAPTTPALPATTSDATVSSSTPALSSSPAATGGVGVTSSTEVTSTPVTDSTLIWSPTMVLSVTVSEVTFSIPDSSPTDSASYSLPSLSNSASSSLITASPPSSSSYSLGAGSSTGPVSSAYYSSSVGVSSYNYGAGTYPISISPEYSSSSAAVAGGPTYTSTYTYVMTRCGAPGVMNCPAPYQSEVVVTRTTTICPATAVVTTTTIASTGITALPIPSLSPQPAGPQPSSEEIVVIVLTPLPTPIVATFVAPTATTTAHVEEYSETAEGPSSTTTATTTSTTTITATVSQVAFQTPTPLVTPGPSVSPGTDVPGNATIIGGTGYVPGATQSGGSSSASSGSQAPVIAGADRLFDFACAYGAYSGVVTTFVAALFVGVV
ncbi:hypothetical protein F5Y12DRAFT_482182 [Xylaria sp. FL1777]|nr:hypothetical protein F5Y12DRAFT_482182 [Xylaria sp. FL1777]